MIFYTCHQTGSFYFSFILKVVIVEYHVITKICFNFEIISIFFTPIGNEKKV